MIDSPFTVGEKYENRLGEYEVVSISGPDMAIQYVDGDVMETTVRLQARITQNLQFEEEVREEAEVARTSAGRRRRTASVFKGLTENDFKRGVAGTSWRARTGLGGMLAQRLSEATGSTFQSYAIYRRAEAQVVQPERYEASIREREAKFQFWLDAQGARYGFYIEKSRDEMDDSWDWWRFLATLDGNHAVRETIEVAMRDQGLQWEVCVWEEEEDDDTAEAVAEVIWNVDGFAWRWQTSEVSEALSWEELTSRLRELPSDKWCEVLLCTYMDRPDAMAKGVEIATIATEVFEALCPLYLASTNPSAAPSE